MPVADEMKASTGSVTKLNNPVPLGKTTSKSNLGSKNNLAGGNMDQATMIAQALEAGQRVYENTYKMKPERKSVNVNFVWLILFLQISE